MTDWPNLFSAHVSEWSARFCDALDAACFDAVVVRSGTEKQIFRDDRAYPFSAEPYFKVWAPLARHPGSAIVFAPGRRPRLVYFEDTSFWHEAPSEPEGYWLEHFDLVVAKTPAEAARRLEGFGGWVANIGEPSDGVDTETWNPKALLAHLDYFRAVKTPYERACMARANVIAASGHSAAAREYRRNASEFRLNQAYLEATEQRETELPYLNIVALNDHAAVLHYQNLTHVVPEGPSSFLLDAGASYNGYAADVTRTHCRGADQMLALIESMHELQQTLCSKAVVGVDFIELNELAHRDLAHLLREHELIRCDAEHAYESGITRTFLPHGLGHLLGLQVHDAGGHLQGPDGSTRHPPAEHPMLRLTRTLEDGFVVTIEPGLYFIPSLLGKLRDHAPEQVNWERVETLVKFGGVRIEDNVCVTEQGPLNLTRAAMQ
jgi:Xaa-Pro dipeptidase